LAIRLFYLKAISWKFSLRNLPNHLNTSRASKIRQSVKVKPDPQQTLEPFLASSDRPEGTLSYHELQGYLFAIACAPEMIMPSEWLPPIFNDSEAGLADLAEAEAVMASIMSLYNDFNRMVLERNVKLPSDIKLKEPSSANIGPESAIGKWSRGFFFGHSWLEELWHETLPEELDNELGACLMTLSIFSERKLANAYYQELGAMEVEPFEDFVDKTAKLFESAMNSYAHIGRCIYEVVLERNSPRPVVHPEKVGRNSPCPCGSGKKYKHCCLQ